MRCKLLRFALFAFWALCAFSACKNKQDRYVAYIGQHSDPVYDQIAIGQIYGENGTIKAFFVSGRGEVGQIETKWSGLLTGTITGKDKSVQLALEPNGKLDLNGQVATETYLFICRTTVDAQSGVVLFKARLVPGQPFKLRYVLKNGSVIVP